ncbi:MAG TPA: winged helix-turn-helix domain-containing protein, partial [Mycobacteriales bacterium]|nr:winged helix-turn-helix domain-containing protein [Mycobacteriales bacterium]
MALNEVAAAMIMQVTSETGVADADGAFPVRFELLGGFRVLCHGQPVEVGGPTAQAVLICLLHHRNERVSRQRLTDDTWGQHRAVSPDTVYHYMRDLRRALEPAGLTITGRPDYRLDVPDHAVDSVQFDTLVTSARALRDTDPDEALHRFGRALNLWHGPTALPGIDLPGARAIA